MVSSHRCRNDSGVASLTITPKGLRTEFLHPIPATLSSACLEVLDPGGGVAGGNASTRGNGAMVLLRGRWDGHLALGSLLPPNHQEAVGFTLLAGRVGPNDQGERGLRPHSGGKKGYVCNPRGPLQHLLVRPRAIATVNAKVQQPKQGGRLKTQTTRDDGLTHSPRQGSLAGSWSTADPLISRV